MNLLYATSLAILALALLCSSCEKKEEDPVPTTTLDISGEWLIRTNDWRKIRGTEWNSQDIYPGKFEFEPLVNDSAYGAIDYEIDGETIQEDLYYKLNGDSLTIQVENRGRYTALGVTESEIRLEGRRLYRDDSTGNTILLAEKMLLER